MSQVIDRKVVDMEFNNSRFEKNVSQTMSTLDKLKEKLNFKGLEKSFDTIEASSKNIKMDGLSSAVQTVSAKFSALEVIGVTALANIANSAVNFGKNFLKSLSIDQISSGWEKYANKTEAVQTIMAATRNEFAGVSNQMELVEEQLNRLNWFTDETSYKFVDMVANIGKFTSTGTKLEPAVTAMMGIATWAAISGANAEKASHAMYNLSQAMGQGVVQLKDWMSIANANMSTVEFKETVIQTGLALGTLKKNADGTITTLKGVEVNIAKFESSLSEKWLTSDVLIKALDAYGGFANALYDAVNETGLATTDLLNYIDDYTEGTLNLSDIAKETGLSVSELDKIFKELTKDEYDLGRRALKAAQEAKTFQEAVDYVKEAVSTGWMKTFELIFGNYEKAKKLWSEVAENFYTLFVESGDMRNDLLEAALYKKEWDEFTDSLNNSDIAMKHLNGTQKLMAKRLGLTAAEFMGLKQKSIETGESIESLAKSFKKTSGSDLIIQSIRNAFEALLQIVDVVKKAWHDIFPATTAEQIYNLIERFEKFTASLYLSDEQAEKLQRTLRGLFAVLDIGWYIIQTITGVIKDLVSAIFDLDDTLDITSSIGDFLTGLRDSVREGDKFGKTLRRISEILIKIIKYIKETIKGNTKLGSLIKTITDSVKSAIDKLKEFKKNATEKGDLKKGTFLDAVEKVFSKIKGAIEKVSESLEKAWPTIKNIFSTVWNFISNIGGKAFNWISNLINDIKESETIKSVLGWLSGALTTIVDFISKTVKGENDFGQTIKSVLDSIGEAISTIISKLKDLFNLIFQKKEMPKDSAVSVLETSMVGLQATVGFLSKSLEEVWPTVKNILIGVRDFFKNITNFLTEDGFKNSIGLLKIGVLTAAFLKIRKSFKNLTALTDSFSAMIKSISGAFSGLKSYFLELKKNIKYDSIKNIAIALALLAGSLYLLSKMSWDEFAVGITALGSALLLITGVIVLLNSKFIDEKKVGRASLAVIGISTSLVLFALAMRMIAKLKWEDLAKGLISIGFILAAFVLLGNQFKGEAKGGLVEMAAAMIIVSFALLKFALGLKAFGSIPMDEIIRGLAGMAGVLTAVAAALYVLKDVKFSTAPMLLIVAAALIVLAGALRIIGAMDTASLIKGLVGIAGTLALLVASLYLIKGVKEEVFFLAVMAASLVVLSLAFQKFGSMNWSGILKAFAAIAGTLAIIGVAALVLAPLTPVMLLLGVAIAAVGVGLIALGTGLQILAKALKMIDVIVNGIEKLAKVILRGIEIIIEGLILMIPKLLKTFVKWIVDTIKELIPSLAEIIPMIVDFLLKLAVDLLETLVEYIPRIVELFVELIIKIIDALAEKVPVYIKSLMNLFMSILTAFAEALKEIDPKILAEGLMSIGIMYAIMLAMASLALIAPAAIAGIVMFGLVISELIGVLALLGTLFSNDETIKSIKNAKDVLRAVGEAIGSLIGGIMEGASESLPEVGAYLSAFMTNLDPFIKGVNALKEDTLTKAMMLPKILLAVLGTEILDKITGWLTGGMTQSVITFGEQIILLGSAISQFAAEVEDIDPASVEASANAALVLTKFANNIPREGGILGDLIGTRGLPQFASGLIDIGKAISEYYLSIKDVDNGAVEASANAALTLTEFAKNIPNEGGLIAKIVGDNTLSQFAIGLQPIGKGISDYYHEIKDVKPETVEASANAAKVLAEFANNIPNEGGLQAKIFGDNTITQFATHLPRLGATLKTYAANVDGIDGGAVEASANAALAIAELANNLPNEGGVIGKIFGDNTLSDFANHLKPFGEGIKEYSDAIDGIKIDAIDSATKAAVSIVNVAKIISENDLANAANGISGDNSLSKFSKSLKDLGNGLYDYSKNVSGVNRLSIDEMRKATNALGEIVATTILIPKLKDGLESGVDLKKFGESLKYLAIGLRDYYQNISGENAIDTKVVGESLAVLAGFEILNKIVGNHDDFLTTIFKGDSDLKKFGEQLPYLGAGLAGYADAIKNSTFDDDKVKLSVSSAQKIAELQGSVTKLGGVIGFFAGTQNLQTFGEQLPKLATGIVGYWNEIKLTEFDTAKIETSITAATKIATLYDYLDKTKGVIQFFTGTSDLTTFGNQLKDFAKGLVDYANEIVTANVDMSNPNITKSIDFASRLASTAHLVGQNQNFTILKKFGASLSSFATELDIFIEKIGWTDEEYALIDKAISDTRSLLSLMQDIDGLKSDSTKNFVEGLKKLGESAVDDFVKSFDDGHNTIKTAVSSFVSAAETEARGFRQRFYDAGKYVVRGFANGLKDAEALKGVKNAAREVGKAAINATENVLDSHSPSKVYESLGSFCPIGLYNGVMSNLKYSEMAGKEIGESALSKTRKILSNISTAISEDINTDPVIRPVLDLDGIESGSNRINALLSSDKAYSIYAKADGILASDSLQPATEQVNNWNFTQNNYSPKSLSASEIYRNTKNQFSALKRRTNSV